MSGRSVSERLAVCSWSLRPKGPADLIAQLKQIGILKVQLALDPLRADPAWVNAKQQLAAGGVAIIAGMMGCEGEDYATLESIRRTGGVVPDATWPATWQNIQQMVAIAKDLGLEYVTFHAGFLPEEPASPAYTKLQGRLSQVAGLFAGRGITLGLETGQEDGPTLRRFLDRLNKPNVAVNFDPANIILYDKGDPIDALRALAPRVRQCHIKDAVRTTVPGQWGQEVVVGTGQVPWPKFFEVLDGAGFDGYLSFEREAGESRIADIVKAKEHVLAVASAQPASKPQPRKKPRLKNE
ncbi:MAG: sugar phosphate isomerase/epimerase family protein [Planctomycetota bacterium]